MADAASTLVLFAHPAVERARLGPALAAAAEARPEVVLHDLYERYPDFTVDVQAEQRALVAASAVVMQFPLYWYSCPALLKEWMDLVLTHGFAYGAGETRLRGKRLACAVSTGGHEADYGAGGVNRFEMADFLRPLEQTAALCGMDWLQPFVSHGAMHGGAVEAEADRYDRWLADLSGGAL